MEAIEARFGRVDRVPEKIQWLSDNGPAYVAHDTQNFARMMGMEVCTTPYYSPESNGMAESFVKTFKRDYVHMNPLNDAKTVLEKIPGFGEDPRFWRRSPNGSRIITNITPIRG